MMLNSKILLFSQIVQGWSIKEEYKKEDKLIF